jgi:tRNA(Ile)-lysidine synthase
VKASDGGYLSGVRAQSEADAVAATVEQAVEQAVERAVAALPFGRWLLAVSGGRDSMVLLHALATARRAEIAAVATFDHGTGPAARKACLLVERTALEHGIPVVSGVMPAPAATESDWRTARWRFLQAWSEELRATIVTAHTQDDQVETIVQRILRGSGARGLAGMAAMGPVARPLLGVPRAAVAAYAAAHAVRCVEDPSNQSRAHQRNRVRHDLLPALELAQPGFSAWCLALAARAASVRATLDAIAADVSRAPTGDGTLVVRAEPLAALGPDDWAALWPALAARLGLAMDRRGIERAAAWAPRSRAGAVIPLAGGARIERTAATFVIRRRAAGTTSGEPDYILNE